MRSPRSKVRRTIERTRSPLEVIETAGKMGLLTTVDRKRIWELGRRTVEILLQQAERGELSDTELADALRCARALGIEVSVVVETQPCNRASGVE